MIGLEPSDFAGAMPIDGYGPGFFRIGGQVRHGAQIVRPEGAQDWVGLTDQAALFALAGQVDVLLLGMGAEIAHPPAGLIDALAEQGVMAEIMASPAAARTYNVLLSEGRRVAAALLPV
ncbi:MAG: Mth938-like domain-containing protein [Paracoccus sp. (in: a-proteobacteria)]|uniref:Mth938-like domain-containing protein n=1 Tax=Paracoccus sp. TaxID=267 RepID=UPI0026DFF4D9|nr:Mth938-like domain-containing protein [Paracoccus sp. (in: a-proteobacteria)]MDO5620120.1 Mth938-like domain-containing protein [Paracoccus sp. (in: a-proteobacteria)]